MQLAKIAQRFLAVMNYLAIFNIILLVICYPIFVELWIFITTRNRKQIILKPFFEVIPISMIYLQ